MRRLTKLYAGPLARYFLEVQYTSVQYGYQKLPKLTLCHIQMYMSSPVLTQPLQLEIGLPLWDLRPTSSSVDILRPSHQSSLPVLRAVMPTYPRFVVYLPLLITLLGIPPASFLVPGSCAPTLLSLFLYLLEKVSQGCMVSYLDHLAAFIWLDAWFVRIIFLIVSLKADS